MLLSVPGKVFTHVLLARVKSRLHDHRRIEQTGFMPKRSTVDRILTLNMIYQQHTEFNQPMWVAHVDLKADFNSVDRTALWQLLLSVGLPHQIVDLFKALYTDSVSCVRADGCESEWFPVNSGVPQGCVVAPDAFLVPMDWLLESTVHRQHLCRHVNW